MDMNMLKSMTGFGRSKRQIEGMSFLVEIKTVNHRYCDVFVKMQRQISFLEEKVREMVQKSISRGKVDVFITFEDFSDDSRTVVIDEGLASAYLKALHTIRDQKDLVDDISVSLVSRFPDVMRVEKAEYDEKKMWAHLQETLKEALSSLLDMRRTEGEGLKVSLLEKIQYMEKMVEEIGIRSPEVVNEYRCKLENRIKELLSDQVLDENRLAQEVAYFADRCSIDEELVRLKSHFAQFLEAFSTEQSVGRKLDFLVQEMNREINTIGSKANDLNITKRVVELKCELEKIREQIQNIE
jgi:uncharacterized protein (TIGR00255 family)